MAPWFDDREEPHPILLLVREKRVFHSPVTELEGCRRGHSRVEKGTKRRRGRFSGVIT